MSRKVPNSLTHRLPMFFTILGWSDLTQHPPSDIPPSILAAIGPPSNPRYLDEELRLDEDPSTERIPRRRWVEQAKVVPPKNLDRGGEQVKKGPGNEG